MNSRSRTIASFFSVAMAAMLLGAVLTTQIQQPRAAQAGGVDTARNASPPPVGPGGAITLDTFKEIARTKTPAVVNINTSRVVTTRSRDPFREFFGDDFMERFFGPQGGLPERQTQRSLGSGFIIGKDGYILTNRHVIEGAEQIQVTLSNGKNYDAKLVGKDARTDVALLKIDPKEALTVLEMGDSGQTEVGEWVIAIGNPFGLGGNSVTAGLISYKGRNIPLSPGTGVDMIQTDAAINPGNSGGPLINMRGQAIGINTMIITRGVPQSSGVGFAVPINVAKDIVPQLREKGKVTRGWLGVQIQDIDEKMARTFKMKEAQGALVSEVTNGSPADKVGLQPGDVIRSVDGHEVKDRIGLSNYIASKSPGSTVTLQVLRDGSERTFTLSLGTFPEQTEEQEGEGERQGKLGMTYQDLSPSLAERLELPRTARGVVVLDVEAGEAAEEAGLQRGDVIVSVNGQNVESVGQFEREIDKARKDGVARLRVRRGTGYLFLVLNLS